MFDSLYLHQVRAWALQLIENTNFWNAMIIIAGTLFTVATFPFYSTIPLIMLLSFTFIISYKYPQFGLLFGALGALFAVAYQSPVMGLVYFLGIMMILVILIRDFVNKSEYAIRTWKNIAVIQILLFAPFAIGIPMFISSIIFMIGVVAGALYLGSKRSAMIIIPTVLLILLLSSLWIEQNNSFMPTSDLYQPKLTGIERAAQPIPEMPMFFATAMGGIAGLGDTNNFMNINTIFAKLFNNIIILLVQDSAIIQLLSWTLVVYLIGMIPGILKNKYKQTIAVSMILLIPISNYLIIESYSNGAYAFDITIIIYSLCAVATIFIIDLIGFTISKEEYIRTLEQSKKFEEFGLKDLSLSGGPKCLDDIGNYDDVKEELKRSIVTPLTHSDLARAYDIKPANGILLFGPPGTGKTIMMTALAKELKYSFLYVKCSDLLGAEYGKTEKNMAKLFKIANKNAPCILFFDEIDTIGKSRDKVTDSNASRILSSFLQEMDGFKTKKKTIVLGATNVPHMLDHALMRPGRFDKIIYMHLPDAKGREKIFKIHCDKLPLTKIDLKALSRVTERFSGADIENICREARANAAERASKKGKVVPLTMDDFLPVIKHIKPSTSIEKLEMYERFKITYQRRVLQEEQEEEYQQVKMTDIAGLDKPKKFIKEAIDIPLLRPDLIEQYKVSPPTGLLMFGPPGCGKTMLAKAVTNSLDVKFMQISGADLIRGGITQAVKELHKTFNLARENCPAVLFIDEIDSITSSDSMFGKSLIGQLLIEMDGVKKLPKVIVIGTTNKPWLLDPALMRPGRFDKIVYIGPPDASARKSIFVKQLNHIKGKVDYDYLAKLSEGYTGADIVAICQEVKMQLVRKKMSGHVPRISDSIIIDVLHQHDPSVNKEQLNTYINYLNKRSIVGSGKDFNL